MAAHGHGALMEESPYAIPSRKLTMWLFIISDAVTFGAFLFSYGYIRVSAAHWTRPFESSSVIYAIVVTAVLITSRLTILGTADPSEGRAKATVMPSLYSP